MAIRNVIVEVPRKVEFESSLFGAGLSAGLAATAADAAVQSIAGLVLDHSFAPIPAPRRGAASATRDTQMDAETTGQELPASDGDTVLLRGTIDDSVADPDMLAADTSDCRVYADPVIDPFITCGGSPPTGAAEDIARLLATAALHRNGKDGRGVLLGIVDTGVNLDHLRARGLSPKLDDSMSWTPPLQPGQTPMTPGRMPVGHGTMCAFDALIAAPAATLLDIAVLASRRPGGSPMDGLLSDAILGYSHLLQVMRSLGRPGGYRSLVVSNSWGIFRQSWDFPPGHPGNYSHNPHHPFNLIVGTLERAGADILFAAGNCGRECPDSRCGDEQDAGIYGANSHPAVLSVAGVDIHRQRVGYSTRGPGKLDPKKPDIACYTHFKGSEVYPADGGTSAATPVAAGLVAAMRSQYPSSARCSPSRLRELIRMTADNVGPASFDPDTGFGIPNGLKLDRVLSRLLTDAADLGAPAPGDLIGLTDMPDESVSDEEFMAALKPFTSFSSAPESRKVSPCCPECAGQRTQATTAQETMMSDVTDQEFMQALSAYMPTSPLSINLGAGTGNNTPADFGFSAPGSAEVDDQAFMAALQVYGGPTTLGGGAGALSMAVDTTAAPSLADVCRVWRTVSPIMSRILSFIGVIPFIGGALTTALRTLSTLLNGVCSNGPAGAAALCQRWRGGLRSIVVRVAGLVGAIPVIGSGARSALNALINAIDTVCRGM